MEFDLYSLPVVIKQSAMRSAVHVEGMEKICILIQLCEITQNLMTFWRPKRKYENSVTVNVYF